MNESRAIGTDEAWHTVPIDEAARRLDGDAKRGLSPEVAAQRLQQHGPNELQEKKGRSKFAIFVAQFKSLIILLLALIKADEHRKLRIRDLMTENPSAAI